MVHVYPFHKEKYTNGKFDRDKVRIVALGNLLESAEKTFSPTVNPATVFTQIAYTARQRYINKKAQLSAYDIKKAFLNTPRSEPLAIKVPAKLAKWWTYFYPSRQQYIEPDGSLYFLLHAYLYGIDESPARFNEHLHNILVVDLGFRRSKADQCLYIKQYESELMTACVHVDDILLSSPNSKARKWFEVEMEKKFEITKQIGDVFYLGMNIKRTDDGYTVDQHAYIDTVLKKFVDKNDKNLPKTPASPNFFQTSANDQPVSTKKYLSLVMSIMYMARYTRPDIAMPTCYLATKSASPCQSDYNKAVQILLYIKKTRSMKLSFKGKSKLIPVIYADASHGVHMDGKGHGGIIICLGDCLVYWRSYKLKLITRSSSESEFVVLEESATYALWFINLLKDFGIEIDGPLTIFQDNKSTMIIALKGGVIRSYKTSYDPTKFCQRTYQFR
jgi:hypothetical protein